MKGMTGLSNWQVYDIKNAASFESGILKIKIY